MDQHNKEHLALKRFLAEIVIPNVNEYLARKDSLRHAFNACWSLDALASHIFIVARQLYKSSFKKEADFKNHISERCRSFKYVWDVSTAPKHVSVTRAGKEIRESSDVQAVAVEGWLAYFMQVPDTEWGGRIMVQGDSFPLKALDDAVSEACDFLNLEAAKYS